MNQLANIFYSLDSGSADMIFQLTVAMLLGLLIGAERSTSNKTAGMRTYALISLGSCLFVVISHAVSSQYLGITNFDPLRIASQIVVGIGFVGGGLIITQDKKITGITTAAGLWVSAGIGMAVGFHLYAIAVFVTLITIFVFTTLWHLERAIKKYSRRNITHSDSTED
jgi:putative Mg2+ transporter-C (MgtC) family protein